MELYSNKPKAEDIGLQKKKRTRLLCGFLMAAILVAQITFLIYYANQKYEYHPDEIWSYGLSNSYYKPFYYDVNHDNIDNKDVNNETYGKWMTGSDFFKYLTVQKDEQFSYGSVYYNQTQDVHPPLYYFILHTICSFFPDTFSKWYGIGINLVCIIFIQLLLYKIGRLMSNSRKIALLACALWGFSVAAINAAVFIRMYTLLTCFVLLTTLLHIKMLSADEPKLKLLPFVFVVTFLGGFTHYYFFIYAFFLTLCCCIYFIKKRKFKKCAIYAVTVIAAVGLVAAVFPSFLYQFNGSNRGTEAVDNLKKLNLYPSCMTDCIQFILKEMYGAYINTTVISVGLDVLSLLILLAAAYMAIRFVIKGKPRTFCDMKNQFTERLSCWAERRNFHPKFINVAVILSVFLNIYIVSITYPSEMGINCDRYFCNMFPLVALFFIWAFVIILNRVKKFGKYRFVILACITCYFVIFSNLNTQSQYLYPKTPYTESINTYSKGANVIYMTQIDLFLHTMSDSFMYSNKVFPTHAKDTDKYVKAINGLDPSQKNILIISTTDSCKKATLAISQKTKYTAKFLCFAEHGECYMIFRLDYKSK